MCKRLQVQPGAYCSHRRLSVLVVTVNNKLISILIQLNVTTTVLFLIPYKLYPEKNVKSMSHSLEFTEKKNHVIEISFLKKILGKFIFRMIRGRSSLLKQLRKQGNVAASVAVKVKYMCLLTIDIIDI